MTCPSSDQLVDLLSGSLSPAATPSVATHLDHCETCQRELERLTADADSLGEELRRPVVRPTAAAELASVFDHLDTSAMPAPVAADERPAIPGYTLFGELGRGGQGVVYKARDETLQRIVALKLLGRTGPGDDQTRYRFRREAETLARLQHPNIVQIYDVGEVDGRPFFTMEFVPGGTLAATLAGTPQPIRAAAALLQTLAEAIHAAHEVGVVHRDLKPANILLGQNSKSQLTNSKKPPIKQMPNSDQTGNGLDVGTWPLKIPCDLKVENWRLHAKITDFGLAKPIDTSTDLTHSGMLIGTPSYMAPEQVQGRAAEVGPATDVYALGAILYQLLTGRPPFQGTELMDLLSQVAHADPLPPRRLLPGLPRDLNTICLKCLEKEPTKRYASAADLAEDLRRYLNNEPITARPVSAAGRAWRWCRRNPLAAGALAASVACLILGSAAATAFGIRANRLAGQRQLALERVTLEEGKTKTALDRVTTEKQRAQDALDQAREALDVTTDEVLVNLLSKQQKFGEPEKAFLRKTLAQHQRLVATAGDDTPEARFARASGLHRCAAIRHRLGELSESIAAGRDAVAIFRKLVEDVPANPAYARRLAVALNDVAVTYKLAGNPAEAIAACREARDVLTALAADGNPQTDYLLEISGVHGHLANLYTMAGSFTAAETSYRAAIAIDRELAAAHPDNADFQKRLAANLQNFTLLLIHVNRLAEAESTLKAAQAILRNLPPNPDLRQQLALGFRSLATVYCNTRRLPAAQQAFESARDIQTALAAEFPSAPDYRQQLSLTLVSLAQVLRDRGQVPEAIDVFRKAIDIREKLAGTFARRDYQEDLVAARNTLGIILKNAGRLPEAATVFTSALGGYKDLAMAATDNADYSNGVAGVMVNLAQVRLSQKNSAAARRLLEEAVPYHKAALKAAPQQPDCRRFYRNNRETLLKATLALADHAAAAAAAEDLARCDVKAVADPYYAACGMAQCAALAEKDESLPTPQRTAAATAYADRAVALLRVAATKGLRDAPGLMRESAFAPIRTRPDFQALVKDMSEKPTQSMP